MGDECVKAKRPITGHSAVCGRNQECICGSGLKYKKCHGKVHTLRINGRGFAWQRPAISYEIVCQAAGFNLAMKPEVTVGVHTKQRMMSGQSVMLVDGMEFTVKHSLAIDGEKKV